MRFGRLLSVAWLLASLMGGTEPAADAPSASLLHAPQPFTAAVRSRFPPEVKIRRLRLHAASADLEVQDPSLPENVDQYTFEDGALGKGESVQAGRSTKAIRASVFPLADLDLSIVPGLLADARGRARTAEAEVILVWIERTQGGPSDSWGPPRLQMLVDGPRGGAVVEYSLEGRHRRTSRW
jgi:hypothetical protein